MTYNSGTATDYLDMLSQLVQVVTSRNLASITLVAGGSGYEVSEILNIDNTGSTRTHDAKIEVLTVDGGGAILTARRDAFASILPLGGPAVRRLDVTLLGAALEACAGLDAAAVADGTRLTYTKDAAEALQLVDASTDGADAAFLLDATPAAEIIAVAAEGDVMPQKSTYIYPKAITGLVINPLEG